jgi:glyoxylase-like metal-dependent hydrolase (beta-lactamase superfamily II)
MTDDCATPHVEEVNLNVYGPRSVTIGSSRVTALYDGHFNFPVELLQSGNQHLVASDPMFRADVNAFLVQTGDRNYLIDTGAGAKLGPDFNKLPSNLQAAGLTADDVDAVLLTHIHVDHTSGLVDADNRAIFGKAQIFVHQSEIDYWLSEESSVRGPSEFQQFHDMARDAFKPYAGRIEPFDKGGIVPGIEAIPLFGHTPGHCGFQIDGGGNDQLLIWGDIVHDPKRQTRDPDISILMDLSPADARATRWSLFDRVSADDMFVTGMHVTYPGFGKLRRLGTGFDFVPETSR